MSGGEERKKRVWNGGAEVDGANTRGSRGEGQNRPGPWEKKKKTGENGGVQNEEES